MPTAHGFRVTVETFDNETFTEYGTKTHRASERTISTKIESRASTKFRIRIQAVGPFSLPESNIILEQATSFYAARIVENYQPDVAERLRSPPWDIEAAVFVDGEQHDSKIHKLDFDCDAFRDGAIMSHKCSKDAKGIWRRWNWIFSEEGVDAMLSRLDITSSSSPPTRAVSSSRTSPPGKHGTIEVHLARFVQTSKASTTFQMVAPDAMQEAAEAPDDGRWPLANGPHSVTLANAEGKNEECYYVRGDMLDYSKPYAKFVFQYMPRTKLINLGLLNVHKPYFPAALSALEPPTSGKRKRSVSLTSLPTLDARTEYWGQLVVYRSKRTKDAGYDANPEPIIQGARLKFLGGGLSKPSNSLALRTRSASLSSGAAGDGGSRELSRIELMAETAGTQSMTLAVEKLHIEESAKDTRRDDIAGKGHVGGEGATDVDTKTDDEFVAGAADSDDEDGEEDMGSSSE
ncbi:uncharacterized protein AB675_9401 [Cyphellophora attinorum]|uniref:Uncharacterized protein n=1 Tax=Cyphellophora attinorum TaxID=1664694 RepID=A0A0N1H6G7_9EURO|nr:uncharacterized protein AB675_9401 [Phialophora attinorum]KPI41626.1 hypothetical protein AB675_9401 [Phialophora attinorum]